MTGNLELNRDAPSFRSMDNIKLNSPFDPAERAVERKANTAT